MVLMIFNHKYYVAIMLSYNTYYYKQLHNIILEYINTGNSYKLKLYLTSKSYIIQFKFKIY